MNLIRMFMSPLLCVALSWNALAVDAEVGYDVTYAGGSLPTVKSGAGLKLYISSERVRLLKSGGKVAEISSKSITEVTYGQEVHHRYGTAAAIAVVSLGIGAIVAFSKSKKHYIGVSWKDSAGEGGLVFQADKNEFRGILIALEAVSGRKVSDPNEVQAVAQPTELALTQRTTPLDLPAPPAPPIAPIPAPAADPSGAILVRFTSDPAGAEVSIDGEYWGGTPTMEIRMQSGPHTIAVKKRGFQRWERKVTLMPGDSRTINAELETEAKDPNKPRITGLDPSN